MKSVKLSLKKKFIIIWGILAVILLISILFTIAPYSKYKKGQTLAIGSMVIATGEQFDEYKTQKELAKAMYDYFNRNYSDIKTKYGTIDYSSVRDSIQKTDDSLRKILENEGYDEGWNASHYFKYTNFFSYYLGRHYIFLPLFGILCGIVLIINILYILSRKVEITINENTIIYKKFTGKSKQFMIKDVTSAETTILKGLKITGTGIKVKTFLLTNNEKLKDYIRSLIPNNTISNLSMADELKKYKDLLDSEVITQEEFDKKKRELLK